jgi:hypothetical protein
MPRQKTAAKSKNGSNGANLGFEATVWAAADKLRNNMDAAEYKHVVLGLIFLKYISDVFEERHAQLLAEAAHGADPEDPDEYRAGNVFSVPKEVRWRRLQKNAKQPTIGKLIDDAMVPIERDNKSLKGVLPKEFACPALDKQRLDHRRTLIRKGVQHALNCGRTRLRLVKTTLSIASLPEVEDARNPIRDARGRTGLSSASLHLIAWNIIDQFRWRTI